MNENTNSLHSIKKKTGTFQNTSALLTKTKFDGNNSL